MCYANFFAFISLINSLHMAKRNLKDAITEAIASGAIQSESFKDSKGEPLRVRQMDSDWDPLTEGDIIFVPENSPILGVKFGNNEDELHLYVTVEVKSVDGTERNFRLFPNYLARTLYPWQDGKRLAKVRTTGTATDLYVSKDTIDEAFELLRGKSIRVSRATLYTIKDRYTNEFKDRYIYQFDLIE